MKSVILNISYKDGCTDVRYIDKYGIKCHHIYPKVLSEEIVQQWIEEGALSHGM